MQRSSQPRQILLVFLAYYGINCFANIYFIFGPLYEQFGATPKQVGLFMGISFLAMFMCRPFGSLIMERIGMRRALIGGSLLCAATGAGMALSLRHPGALLFFRALSGVSISVYCVAAVSYQSMVLDEESRGRGFALFATASMIPMATAVPFAEWLLRQGWTNLYLWLPVAVSFACLAVSLLVEDGAAAVRKQKAWGRYADLFRVKGVKTLYLTCFLMSVADGSTSCAAQLAAEKSIPVSYFMVTVAIAAIFIRTAGYRIMNLFPRMLLAATSAALMGISLVCMTFTSSTLLFAVFGLTYGIGIGIGYPTDLALVGDLLPVEYHPKATGSLLLSTDCGWFITPIVFGYISPVFGAGGSFRIIGLTVAAASLAVHFLIWRPLWRERRRGAASV